MSKKMKHEVLDDELIIWLTKQFPQFISEGLKKGASWSEIIGSIIVEMDQQLASAENILKQMEAMTTAKTSDEEGEGRPND